MTLQGAYCSVTDVLDEVRNKDADQKAIAAAIMAASRFIDRHRGRDFYLHDHTSTPLSIYGKSGFTGSKLFLPFTPIIELTALVIDGTTYTQGTDFYFEGGYALVTLGGDWPVTDASLTLVTGKFGFPARSGSPGVFDAPPNIVRACTIIAGAVSGHMRKDVLGLDGNIQSIASRDIPKAAFDLLGPPVVRY